MASLAAFKALGLPHPRGGRRASRRVQAQRDDERMLLAARRVDAGATEDIDGLIDGLLKTKTDYREKDVLDKKQVLRRIREQLERG